jgi:hypothetical protein
MDRLPLEMICEIASHLKDNDLVSFSLVNKDTNSILKKTITKDWDNYKLCVVYEYNKRVFDKYNNDTHNGIKDSYYLKCLICFKRQRFIYPEKYNHFICRKCCRRYFCPYNTNIFKDIKCNCLRKIAREFIIGCNYYPIVNEIVRLLKDHECDKK